MWTALAAAGTPHRMFGSWLDETGPAGDTRTVTGSVLRRWPHARRGTG